MVNENNPGIPGNTGRVRLHYISKILASMKQFLIVLSAISICSCSFGQVDRMHIADSISSEGKKLYKSEMASWYGTDVFVERFKSERENIDGYFSYPEADSYKCIFFSKGNNPEVLATIM